MFTLRAGFLLGITATPDRMDGKDIYALCDNNVAFYMYFIEAINRGWLSSFRYYGIYDAIDYSGVTWLGSRYDEQELLSEQLKDDVVNRIYDAWQQHKLTRTLAFCSSIAQADYLASFFRSQGHPGCQPALPDQGDVPGGSHTAARNAGTGDHFYRGFVQ